MAEEENVSGATPTQLSDTRPQLDSPLRVAIPVNAPVRTGKMTRDAHIRVNAFSPAALSSTKQALPELLGLKMGKRSALPSLEGAGGGSSSSSSSSSGGGGSSSEKEASVKTAISDFSVLAFSSKRSGKKDVESQAYVSLGVIYDNQGNFLQAIENYKLYADICDEIGDVAGHACACNCLAVDYMMLASPPSDAGLVRPLATQRSQASLDFLNQAIVYNLKHLEIGPDAGGRFVANTNLGLCLGMVGEVSKSAKHHQDALRIAIKMQTLYGQSIAVGNLGTLALTKNDFSTARTCFEQHLQLVQALLDPEAEVNAWKMLARLCSAEENFRDSLENLEQARRIATREGLMNELRRINCLIGVARGGLEFNDFAEQLVQGMA